MIIKERYEDEEYSDNKDYSVSVSLGEAVECYDLRDWISDRVQSGFFCRSL